MSIYVYIYICIYIHIHVHMAYIKNPYVLASPHGESLDNGSSKYRFLCNGHPTQRMHEYACTYIYIYIYIYTQIFTFIFLFLFIFIFICKNAHIFRDGLPIYRKSLCNGPPPIENPHAKCNGPPHIYRILM